MRRTLWRLDGHVQLPAAQRAGGQRAGGHRAAPRRRHRESQQRARVWHSRCTEQPNTAFVAAIVRPVAAEEAPGWGGHACAPHIPTSAAASPSRAGAATAGQPLGGSLRVRLAVACQQSGHGGSHDRGRAGWGVDQPSNGGAPRRGTRGGSSLAMTGMTEEAHACARRGGARAHAQQWCQQCVRNWRAPSPSNHDWQFFGSSSRARAPLLRPITGAF